MRIAVFSECYGIMNGVVVSIDTFRKELEKRGHEVIVFSTETPDCKVQDDVIRIPAILRFRPKGGRYPIARAQSIGKWAKIVAPYNFDLVHSQHLLSLGSLGLKVAKRLNLPAVLTYHTLLTEYAHYVPVIGRFLDGWIIRKSRTYCNLYNAVIAPSPSMKKLLIEYGVTTPITVIPTGINLDDFANPYTKEELQAKYHLPASRPFLFLYVSRIGKEKNVYFLINAMKKLVSRRQDAHLLMVGGGDEIKKVKSYVRNFGLADHITFTGSLEKPETNKIFGAADVFVFASVTETQGIIIQEAQASCLPVIAVNKMGPSDYINDGKDGFLVPLNVAQFAAKMEYLMTHGEVRQRLSSNAKQNVKQFSAQISADKMERLYEEVSARHHA